MEVTPHYQLNKSLENSAIVDYIDVLELAIIRGVTDTTVLWNMINNPLPIKYVLSYHRKFKSEIGKHIIRTDQYFYLLLFVRILREKNLTLGKLRRAHKTLVTWSIMRNRILSNGSLYDYTKQAFSYRVLRFFLKHFLKNESNH
ncbi:hypothetical protein [Psittacicella hinzii]|uniref:Uncharacterized protein n=1 Tax=Psittacicella hinzii TaxID=2028575 RepID=A0A3A1YH49_9GAMM|nr:hypothetical protein [Psittacicella hinzii]RIY37472.1 hypothetical protein CKF58_04950 [Psittacicella hinzii]